MTTKKYRDDECRRCRGLLDTTGWPKWCKACRNVYRRAYCEAHPEYVTKAKRRAAARSPEQRAKHNAMQVMKRKNRAKEQRAAWEASCRARGLLTYAEIAASLGLSRLTLRTQVKNGALHPASHERGRALFAADEVERYRRESKGQFGWTRPDHPLYDTNARMAYLAERHAAAKERRQA